MSQLKNHSDFIQTLEHDDYSDPQTKRVSMYGWDSENLQKTRIATHSDGSLDVNLQDQTTDLISLLFLKDLGSVTLASPFSTDSSTLMLVAGHSTSVGEIICLKEGTRCFQARVLSVVSNTIGLDTPSDFDFTVSAIAHRGQDNMNVDGSVTPAVFQISPTGLNSTVKVDIVKVVGQITDDTAMDSGKFGGITSLTKGIVLRKKNGTYKNIFNAKNNGDIAISSYDIYYDDKAPAGVYGFRFRKVFGGQSEMGVVVRLTASDEDALQLIVQDNLTGLTKFNLTAQGHLVQN